MTRDYYITVHAALINSYNASFKIYIYDLLKQKQTVCHCSARLSFANAVFPWALAKMQMTFTIEHKCLKYDCSWFPVDNICATVPRCIVITMRWSYLFSKLWWIKITLAWVSFLNLRRSVFQDGIKEIIQMNATAQHSTSVHLHVCDVKICLTVTSNTREQPIYIRLICILSFQTV